MSQPVLNNGASNGQIENTVQKAISQGSENKSEIKTLAERVREMEAKQQVLLMGQNQNATTIALRAKKLNTTVTEINLFGNQIILIHQIQGNRP